jgi:hypothetical protein
VDGKLIIFRSSTTGEVFIAEKGECFREILPSLSVENILIVEIPGVGN